MKKRMGASKRGFQSAGAFPKWSLQIQFGQADIGILELNPGLLMCTGAPYLDLDTSPATFQGA